MTNRDAINLLEEVKMLDDTMYAYNPCYEEALDMAISALQQPEQSESEDINFWKKRAREYEEMIEELIDEMARGIKIDSVLITKEGIAFKKKQPEIVRCKDCKYWDSTGYCVYGSRLAWRGNYNDYCSRAKRKEE